MMTEETATDFEPGETLVPHSINGAVPLYPDHPPDTYLPMWRCPHCGEHGVTMKDLWRLYKRRGRLLALKNEYEYDDPAWSHYNDGIQATNQEISQLLWALPANISKWARENTDPYHWQESQLNPDNHNDD